MCFKTVDPKIEKLLNDLAKLKQDLYDRGEGEKSEIVDEAMREICRYHTLHAREW